MSYQPQARTKLEVAVTLGVLVELPDAVTLLLGDSDDVEVPVFVTDDVCKNGEELFTDGSPPNIVTTMTTSQATPVLCRHPVLCSQVRAAQR
jgi:hypothetical protein